jgi:hypothetical protein
MIKTVKKVMHNFLLAETIKYCKQRKIFRKPLTNDWLEEEA